MSRLSPSSPSYVPKGVVDYGPLVQCGYCSRVINCATDFFLEPEIFSKQIFAFKIYNESDGKFTCPCVVPIESIEVVVHGLRLFVPVDCIMTITEKAIMIHRIPPSWATLEYSLMVLKSGIIF